ncbi:MAG: hypothetical protein VYE77_07270, partial [Planctomycetota bacterium]|nr:hypothetical protein [Planctomycetota bacterium]
MLSRTAGLTFVAALLVAALLVWALLGPWSGEQPRGMPVGGQGTAESLPPEAESGQLESSERLSNDGVGTVERARIEPVGGSDQPDPEEQRAREVVDRARNDGRQVVVAEVIGLRKVDEAHYPLLGRTEPAYYRVQLCAFSGLEEDGSLSYHLLSVQTSEARSQALLQVSPRHERLEVGQVREFVVEGVALQHPVVKTSEHALILFVGPAVDAPYGDKVATMPRSLFRPLAQGAAIFTGEIVERSWRPSDRLHQLAGLGSTVDVLEVVVDEVVQEKFRLAPRVRLRLDVPQGPRLMEGR